MKLSIVNRWTGKVIVEGEYDDIKSLLEANSNSDLRDSDLRGSDLSGSDLRGSDLSGSDLRGSNLRGSDLSGSDLRDSDLSGSDLRGSNLRGSNLSGSDLSGSDLRGSNLRGSNLSGSDLRDSDLSGSDLRDSNLSGSNLRGSDLRDSNLSGSNLSGSNLSDTKNMVKIIGVEPGNTYWKRMCDGLNNNNYQFFVGVNALRDGEVFAADDRYLCSYPGFHFASRSWCAVNYSNRPLEAKIRIPEDAKINEPWATDGKASADKIEILQVFDVETGKDVTDDFRRPEHD